MPRPVPTVKQGVQREGLRIGLCPSHSGDTEPREGHRHPALLVAPRWIPSPQPAHSLLPSLMALPLVQCRPGEPEPGLSPHPKDA